MECFSASASYRVIAMINFPFPAGFLWGTASSSFQIEGGAFQDQKGLSIWDKASADYPELFENAATPRISTDFYNRYREDIRAMRDLGLKSFRISIAWPRVFPEGRGKPNEQGAAFYDSLIDCLLEHGIEPFVDLYHWDLPQALADEDGFKNRNIIRDFRTYAEFCFRRYGNRVKLWSTFNEPSVIASASYREGVYPPFQQDMSSYLTAAHNLLLAHFEAVRAFRESGCEGKIGAVIAFVPVYPHTPSPEDLSAASRAADDICNWWLRPMFKGEYPGSVLNYPLFSENMSPVYTEELREAFTPMDFVSLNYYHPSTVKHDFNEALHVKPVQNFYAQTDVFETYPPGMFDTVSYIREQYDDPEIYITENGMAHHVHRPHDTLMEDDDRIHFIREHLREISRAISEGAKIRGYYYWSHFDSYEAIRGYNLRFGLVHVDFDTLKRTTKKSWHYYKSCIETNLVD